MCKNLLLRHWTGLDFRRMLTLVTGLYTVGSKYFFIQIKNVMILQSMFLKVDL